MSRNVRIGVFCLCAVTLSDTVVAQAPLTPYEKEQVRLKERELTLQWQRDVLIAASVLVSVGAALLAYWATRRNQLDQAKAQLQLQERTAQANFQLKAAEIAMASRSSWEARGKAVALAALFPDQLPAGLGSDFDPQKNSWGRGSKAELLALLAAATSAEQRQVILRAWKALFPYDEWIKELPSDL